MARKKKKGRGPEGSLLSGNRSAGHEFHLDKRYEAGIVLTGPEVKSAREGRVNLKDAYARIKNGEVFLYNAHFSPYTHANVTDQDPVRPRKLLLHAAEIRKLAKEIDTSGMTLVPTKLYLKGGRIKVEIAVGRGKRSFDKRETARKKEAQREMARARGSRTLD
ncbi:MAG: SsrA-binding protein SmpB [bacterium]|nr:SsrA-binding protein SmpB [bacterium]